MEHRLARGRPRTRVALWARTGLALAIGIGALPAWACRRAPADPVRALLDELRAAAESRDSERFGARLSEGFEGRGRVIDRSEAVATLRRYFAAYESVGVEVYRVDVDRRGASARVRCVVAFSGRERRIPGLEGLLPPSAAYRFDLDVADEGGTWRVRAAAWEPVEAAEPAEPR